MYDLVILPEKEGKGRSFHSVALAWVEADHIWTGGQSAGDTVRPIWAMFAGSEDEIRAFVANLRNGKKARESKNSYSRHGGQQIELMKSVGYRWTLQRTPEGMVATAFLPDLFLLDPGMVDPKGVAFCCMAPKSWLAEQKLPVEGAVRHMFKLGYRKPSEYDRNGYQGTAEEYLANLAPRAAFWAAYLDRRTRCPLPNDLRFHLQLLVAALDPENRIAHEAVDDAHYYRKYNYQGSPKSMGCSSVGLDIPLTCNCSHETLEKLLAEQVQLYYQAI